MSQVEVITPLPAVNIFPVSSVNLIAGPTFCGKSFLVKQIVEHIDAYFSAPPGRIIIVHCNDRIPDYNTTAPILQVPLCEFDHRDLEQGDLLIFEDVQEITPTIRLCITVEAHHRQLASLFLITHTLVGSRQHFPLLNLCHRVILFLCSGAIARACNYIISEFYADAETKTYLKSVAGFCEQEKTVLLLQINSQANVSSAIPYLGLSHLHQLASEDHPYCLMYKYPYHQEEEPSEEDVTLEEGMEDALPSTLQRAPPKLTLCSLWIK